MTLNGHTYDDLLAEFLRCRDSMKDVLDSRPDAYTYISPGADRGAVGALVSRIERDILPEIQPEVIEESWEGDTRGVRLYILSCLCRRDITSVWDMKFYELRGILDWLVEHDGVNWNLVPSAAKVMKALVTDDDFAILVTTLPQDDLSEST